MHYTQKIYCIQHNIAIATTYLEPTVSHCLVEGQSNGHSTLLIGVKDPCLRPHHLDRRDMQYKLLV